MAGTRSGGSRGGNKKRNGRGAADLEEGMGIFHFYRIFWSRIGQLNLRGGWEGNGVRGEGRGIQSLDFSRRRMNVQSFLPATVVWGGLPHLSVAV